MILRNISKGIKIALLACDGKKILAQASDTFHYIDSDFSARSPDMGGDTPETNIQVYEMELEDANFSQMFNSLSNDLKKLCLSQNQIVNFVKEHENWIHPKGYANFFLFEANKEFFVAHVNLRSTNKLYVHVYRFGDSYVWSADDRHRVVVPQLDA